MRQIGLERAVHVRLSCETAQGASGPGLGAQEVCSMACKHAKGDAEFNTRIVMVFQASELATRTPPATGLHPACNPSCLQLDGNYALSNRYSP